MGSDCHCWLRVGKPGIRLVGLLLPRFANLNFDVSPENTALMYCIDVAIKR